MGLAEWEFIDISLMLGTDWESLVLVRGEGRELLKFGELANRYWLQFVDSQTDVSLPSAGATVSANHQRRRPQQSALISSKLSGKARLQKPLLALTSRAGRVVNRS